MKRTDWERFCICWKRHEVGISWANAYEGYGSFKLAGLDGLGRGRCCVGSTSKKRKGSRENESLHGGWGSEESLDLCVAKYLRSLGIGGRRVRWNDMGGCHPYLYCTYQSKSIVTVDIIIPDSEARAHKAHPGM